VRRGGGWSGGGGATLTWEEASFDSRALIRRVGFSAMAARRMLI